MDSRPQLAVIAGAGPAGLTAAYELLKRTDIRPLVFEATNAIGGLAQTHVHHGNRMDIGGHRFFSRNERVMQWWFNILPPEADDQRTHSNSDETLEILQELLCPTTVVVANDARQAQRIVRRPIPDPEQCDDVMLRRRRRSRIFHRQRFFPYPLQITLGVVNRLGWWNTFAIGASYLWAQVHPLRDETYLDAFFINRFGRRLYRTFFRDYTEKVWGMPCGKIRADWGAQRIRRLSLLAALGQAVRELVSRNQSNELPHGHESLIGHFYYPKFGPGQMWEEVTRQIRGCGGEVSLGQKVVAVNRGDDGRIRTVTILAASNAERREIEVDFFFSTMPIKELVGMMAPAPSADVLAVARGLVYRDFLTVGLLVRKLNVRDGNGPVSATVPDNWIYIQDGSVRVGRVQVFNNWSPYLVADRDNTVWLGLEYFVNEGDSLWSKSDDEMIRYAVDEMERIGFVKSVDVLDGCVRRVFKAYPAYSGTYDQLDEIKRWAATVPNLFLIGRNGMHRYNNQDHSMLAAMTAVDNIVAGRTDSSNLWDVNLERVYQEEGELARTKSTVRDDR